MEEIEGYRREKLTIDLVKANRIALLWLLPIALAHAVPYFLVWRGRMDLRGAWDGLISDVWSWVIILMAMVIGIVLHELIHGLVWSFYAK